MHMCRFFYKIGCVFRGQSSFYSDAGGNQILRISEVLWKALFRDSALLLHIWAASSWFFGAENKQKARICQLLSHLQYYDFHLNVEQCLCPYDLLRTLASFSI